ncbi:winged helix-turn-helix transcriptional regulator [Actinokineospora pegani]|uniref:winged helix-turn-helix transcriptional regulator n=1 Tax=Actinokineospora pegani TaxID=2654637 RepID=UPI0018D305EC|nr:helix-turn-helix domain-containing protein [Actinokineospora pegani]
MSTAVPGRPVGRLGGDMTRYHHHGPEAAALEVLGDPWTLLVVRELLHADGPPEELAGWLPGASAGLVRKRLRALAEHGVVTAAGGSWALTRSGRALRPVIDALGRWGADHLPGPRSDDLDPALLLRDICRGVDRDALPEHPVAVAVGLTETTGPRRWWLVFGPEAATATTTEPRLPVETRLDCSTAALAAVWQGRRDWLAAIRDGAIRLSGSPHAVRDVIAWIGAAPYAPSSPVRAR